MSTNRKLLIAVYYAMLSRCIKPHNKAYPNYGGRGIKVCDEWLDNRELFLKWALSNGYKQGLTLERINPDGNYDEDNCAWVTRTVQSINRRVHGDIKYYGVYFKVSKGRRSRYTSAITVKGKKTNFGLFDTAEEAAQARDDYITANNLDYPLNFT